MKRDLLVAGLLSLLAPTVAFTWHSPPSTTTLRRRSSLCAQDPTRRDVLASSLLIAASTLVASSSSDAASLPWEQNPVNKRSGVTVQTAESAGYNVGFVTYLTRFLLNFDPDIQQYWISNTGSNEKSTIEVFGELAASVEVKLLDFRGVAGARLLLQDLSDRYCPPVTDDTPKRMRREIKEARRQLALLFALLKDIQPVLEISKLLGQIDNASVDKNAIRFNPNASSPLWDPNSSAIIFGPPAVGNARAQGLPVLEGQLVDVRVLNGGTGYTEKDAPSLSVGEVTLDPSTVTATVKNGKVSQIKIKSPQNTSAYDSRGTVPEIYVSPPAKGRAATAEAVVEPRVVGVKLTDAGAGYVFEKPIKIYVGPSRYANSTADELAKLLESKSVTLLGEAGAVSETSSYSSFRKEAGGDEDVKTPVGISASSSGTDDGLPALPFWNPKSPSATFLRLFPAGVGVEYDTNVKRYFLVVDQNIQLGNPTISRRPLGPEFGPRGRAPVERDRKLTPDTLVRFAASGAICASGVHVALTPLDVVKTKVQTNPERYPSVLPSFRTVLVKEGPSAFFSGWIPTLAGNFASGAAVYTLTEFIRRSLSEQAGPLALTYEVPIILLAAAVASSAGSVLSCPFEVVRIRQVAQPKFAPNAVAVFDRIVREEGWLTLANSVPVFLIKNVPYAMTKFLIFDLSTERLYEAFPQATENLKLSLLVSLLGGCLGGTAAAVVSNPADALLSELKKAKSDISPPDAAAALWKRGKFGPFFKGLPVRLVYYSLIASLQFLVYDGVRFALGIGPDDLKLYLDVLGGALKETGGPL